MVNPMPNSDIKRTSATSLIKGEVTKKAIVTPIGIPLAVNAVKIGIAKHEQKGVTAPKIAPPKYPSRLFLPSRNRRTFSTSREALKSPTT